MKPGAAATEASAQSCRHRATPVPSTSIRCLLRGWGVDRGGLYSYTGFEKSSSAACCRTPTASIPSSRPSRRPAMPSQRCTHESRAAACITSARDHLPIAPWSGPSGGQAGLTYGSSSRRRSPGWHNFSCARTMMVGGFWDVIHPGVFIMERGLLPGVKSRAERLAR